MNIIELGVTMFVTQLVFIGSRTWNVRAISEKNMRKALLSGAVVHLSWLASIAIGATSAYQIIDGLDLKYLPIVACSLAGGLIGTYVGLKERIKK